MSTTDDIWSRQLVSGLDGLPLTDAEPIPTPHYEYVPPDSAEFNADMAAMNRASRWIWARALWGQEGQRPKMPDDELLCDFIPGCDADLDLAAAAVDAFARIGDEIAEWAVA